MRTELICVGTELLGGKANTDSTYVCERLAHLGLEPLFITTVGDTLSLMEETVAAALKRSVLVIVTGGLGPTFDDLTRESVAHVTGRSLKVDPEALSFIKAFFERRNITMPPHNERQAQVMDGARLIGNRLGTAPGQILEIRNDAGGIRNIVILLPGPPRELQTMLDGSVLPYLKQFERALRKSFVLHVCGLGESMVDEKIRPIIETECRLEKGTVDFTILAHQAVVDIKATVTGEDELIIDEILRNLKQEFREALGNAVFGEGADTLESVTGKLLGHLRRTLATAESCTGGLAAQKITAVPGSSLYFTQGVVSYANQAKVRLLGVRNETLEAHGAVSEQTAAEMAEGVKKLSGADYALSITGIAGPSGGTPEKPVGLVFIGLAASDGTVVSRFTFSGNRADIRERASNQALELLRRRLLADSVNGAGRAVNRKHR